MAEDGFTALPLSPIRKLIATRMTEAKRTIPHFRAVADIELDALIALRKVLEAEADEGISLNTLMVKACAAALIDVPGVNLQWAGDAVHQYHSADIAIVTAFPGGLSTPIIRGADAKSIWEISREGKALAKRAAEGTLKMDEVFGGSFSVSNLGMYGVEQFDAIINPPQCAILAIGCARARFTLIDGEAPHVVTAARVTLSTDHRAIDGATAGAFLAALRVRIEQPEYLRLDQEVI